MHGFLVLPSPPCRCACQERATRERSFCWRAREGAGVEEQVEISHVARAPGSQSAQSHLSSGGGTARPQASLGPEGAGRPLSCAGLLCCVTSGWTGLNAWGKRMSFGFRGGLQGLAGQHGWPAAPPHSAKRQPFPNGHVAALRLAGRSSGVRTKPCATYQVDKTGSRPRQGARAARPKVGLTLACGPPPAHAL